MELRSSSSLCRSKPPFFHILCIIVYLLLITTNADGFNPLIKLPTNELYKNYSSCSAPVVFNINDFGAQGDGFTDDTKSLQHVWKLACSLPSRAKILIPAGNTYLIRPTDFSGPCQSKVTLRVSGMIVAPHDPTIWEGLDAHKWLYFHEVKNLRVEGGGIIDGAGREWWARSCKKNASNQAVTFHKCKNLKVKNITFFNSPQMHMAFTHCTHVKASRITVIAPADSPNTDGIHISASTHFKLEDVIIGTGDDCLSTVSNSSKIRVKNIVCGPGHGISIGILGKYNSSSSVNDVIVNGAFLFSTENGVRIKTWQGGSGIARKITFENIWMNNVSNPIIIDQYYCDSSTTCLNQTSSVRIDGVTFRNIKGTSAKEEAIVFACSDTYPCKRLYLENVQIITSTDTAKSFCWEAYGTSSGLVYPPSCSCLSSGDIIIRHQVKSNSTRWSKDDFDVV
ncbi:Probable polygalacturonase [Striga hermonthica]|uniref:endo-polygalacturonase n=1 Tax=Striga hermonthica TaxID=68872 RepID=A0A9N7NVL4_STRHE|nr:Probable polygalacturonase [Striga hermonthica]